MRPEPVEGRRAGLDELSPHPAMRTDPPTMRPEPVEGRFGFTPVASLPGGLGRSGVITTPHGTIRTPAFVAVGTKATVLERLSQLIAATKADEVMITTMVYDHAARRHSYELLAEAFGLRA